MANPISLYVTENKESYINLELVVMARWDDKHVKELMIYFAQGPHVTLQKDEGKRFLDSLLHYHEWKKGIYG